MGAGDRQIQQWEQRFSAPFAAFVCDRHVDDYALEAVIHENAVVTHCDFCDREGKEPFAADAHLILERISGALRRNWTDPVSTSSSTTMRARAATAALTFMTSRTSWGWRANGRSAETRLEFVLDSFRESMWTGDDPAVLTEGEARRYSWQLFTETVNHDVRFLFVLLEESDGEDEPGGPNLTNEKTPP